jgi:flagellar biosynthesis protein FliP
MGKIKALILTSDSLRHKYFSDVMSNFFDIKGVIVESKKNYYIKVKKESIKVQEHFNQITEFNRYLLKRIDTNDLDYFLEHYA